MNLIADGVSGRMVAIRGGKYSHSPLPEPDSKPRSIDIKTMYNTDRYRPIYTNRMGCRSCSASPSRRIRRCSSRYVSRRDSKAPAFTGAFIHSRNGRRGTHV
jgi:hypothetical protein